MSEKDRATRSRMMAGIRSKDTRPEIFVRSALHRLGFRFRVNALVEGSRVDLVFPSRRAVVFVHGCFWHGHDCEYFKWPKSNIQFWVDKIEANKRRDCLTEERIVAAGWNVRTVWECEFRRVGYALPSLVVDELADWLNALPVLPRSRAQRSSRRGPTGARP